MFAYPISYSTTASVSFFDSNNTIFYEKKIPYTTYYVVYETKVKDNSDIKNSLEVLPFPETVKKFFNSLINKPFPKFRLLINQEDESAIVEFALAGYKKEDISVTYNNDSNSPQVFIEVKEPKEEMNNYVEVLGNLKKSKCSFGFFLPKYMEVVRSKFENGILSITLKMNVPEDKKSIKIDVE